MELAIDDRTGAQSELVRSVEQVARLKIDVPTQRHVQHESR
jgi:hypothetical protein